MSVDDVAQRSRTGVHYSASPQSLKGRLFDPFFYFPDKKTYNKCYNNRLLSSFEFQKAHSQVKSLNQEKFP